MLTTLVQGCAQFTPIVLVLLLLLSLLLLPLPLALPPLHVVVVCDCCRQLPMLSALLQGRAQFSVMELRARNHILLYTHVLGLVDLLQPRIFHAQYSAAFDSLLHAYFDLLFVCYFTAFNSSTDDSIAFKAIFAFT